MRRAPNETTSALESLARREGECRRCELWRNATQAVPGDGAVGSTILVVGEQPGDQEDLAGHPFVGPAGKVLDSALAAAGIDRARIFLTNAVKHFKFEQRGKRRLHKSPDAGEILACGPWLEAEIAAVRPRVIIALGASAARAVLGRTVPVLASRGRLFERAGARVLVTVHPSYLLRLRERSEKKAAFDAFVADLGVARLAAEPER